MNDIELLKSRDNPTTHSLERVKIFISVKEQSSAHNMPVFSMIKARSKRTQKEQFSEVFAPIAHARVPSDINQNCYVISDDSFPKNNHVVQSHARYRRHPRGLGSVNDNRHFLHSMYPISLRSCLLL